jgi:hypothetical protein
MNYPTKELSMAGIAGIENYYLTYEAEYLNEIQKKCKSDIHTAGYLRPIRLS